MQPRMMLVQWSKTASQQWHTRDWSGKWWHADVMERRDHSLLLGGPTSRLLTLIALRAVSEAG